MARDCITLFSRYSIIFNYEIRPYNIREMGEIYEGK